MSTRTILQIEQQRFEFYLCFIVEVKENIVGLDITMNNLRVACKLKLCQENQGALPLAIEQ